MFIVNHPSIWLTSWVCERKITEFNQWGLLLCEWGFLLKIAFYYIKAPNHSSHQHKLPYIAKCNQFNSQSCVPDHSFDSGMGTDFTGVSWLLFSLHLCLLTVVHWPHSRFHAHQLWALLWLHTVCYWAQRIRSRTERSPPPDRCPIPARSKVRVGGVFQM